MSRTLAAVVLVLVLWTSACGRAPAAPAGGSTGPDAPPGGEAPGGGAPGPAAPDPPFERTLEALVEARVEQLLNGMTLEQKVGQLFTTGFPGTAFGGPLRSLVAERHVGGIILFGPNVASPEQVAAVVRDAQAAALAGVGVPLFVAADQEGGLVMRLERGVALLPGGMGLGATGDPQAAYASGRATGEALRAAGVNWNLAPVVDVNSNPTNPVIGVRSLGDDPELVGRLGAAYARGLQDALVLATAKHFPGHGGTDVDSHLDLPVVRRDRAALDPVELAPFREAIAAGVASIMTAHVVYPGLEARGPAGDPPKAGPATFSPAVIGGLLRGELGYEGLVVTDALEMKAVRDHYPEAELALLALQAGADVALFAGDVDLVRKNLDRVLEAARSGELPAERIDDAVRRVLRAKLRFRLDEAAAPRAAPAEVNPPEHQALAGELALAGVTLVRAGGLPLRPAGGPVAVVAPTATLLDARDPATGMQTSLGRAVARRGAAVREVVLHEPVNETGRTAALEAARGAAAVVIGTADAHRAPGVRRLVADLVATGVPVVAVGLRTPYELSALGAVAAYAVTYSHRTPAVEAAVAVLFGEAPACGRLPVAIPGLHPRGFGLPSAGGP